MDTKERITKALNYAVRFGQIDGAHHKAWVIDQMVRALTGCPLEDKDVRGITFEVQGASEEYRALVADACSGEDGPETYAWDVGIAP